MTYSLAVSWMMVVVVGRVVDSAGGRQQTEGGSWQQTKEKLPPPTKTRFEAVNFYNEEGKGDGRSAAAAVLQ